MISKLIAGRQKDILYFEAACNLNLVEKEVLLERLDKTPDISNNIKTRVKAVINRELDQ